jgi:DNA-binding transcriptional LysR family regulator
VNARQLEVFRAIMRSGSLTAAAAALNVSQPAVSKLLRHFEDQLGFRLFERDSGRLSPTAEAHLLIRDADRIFREIEVLKELAERIRKNELGLLRVGASAPPTFALLPRAIERFRRRHPGIRLEVQTLSAEAVSEGILVGDLDLGVTMAASSEPHLRCLPLGAAEIVVVMPAGSRLAGRDAVRPADLSGESLISYGSRPPIGRALDQVFAEAGLAREVAIEITLSIAAAPLVQRGLGVALVDGLVAWESFPGLAVRPFRPAVAMEIVLATSAQRPETRFAKEFGRDLAAAVADRAG